jgi:hypothetical protein
MTPWAAAIQAQREARDHTDDPAGRCLLHGLPRINFRSKVKIVSTPQLTVLLYETISYLMFRQVFTDGRPLPEVTEPAWMGYSIGRWEGDIFVIDHRLQGWWVAGHPEGAPTQRRLARDGTFPAQGRRSSGINDHD